MGGEGVRRVVMGLGVMVEEKGGSGDEREPRMRDRRAGRERTLDVPK